MQPLLHGEQLQPRSVPIESHTPQEVMLRSIQYRFNPSAAAYEQTVAFSAEAMADGADRIPSTTAATPAARRTAVGTMLAGGRGRDAMYGVRRTS